MKIKTEILQSMITKSIQGASNNKMVPITSLIGIELKDKVLTLMTTDGSNQLRITNEVELDPLYVPQNFYSIVNADIFSKLVGKTTKEFIELENKENYLQVTGNGIYKLELAINEENEIVKFPEIQNLNTPSFSISVTSLQNAIKKAKASVAKTMEVPFLTGYYIGNSIIATNREMVCKLEESLLNANESILLSSTMAELLLLAEGDTINVQHQENNLIFSNSKFTISGKELEGKDMYPVDSIANLVALNHKNSVKINKQLLLNVLDRMGLFVTDYDKNSVYLTFCADGLLIKSKKSNAEELLDIDGIVDDETTFTCLADINMLRSQVEAIDTDTVEMYYGQDKSIKIVEGKCSLVISLVEKAE